MVCLTRTRSDGRAKLETEKAPPLTCVKLSTKLPTTPAAAAKVQKTISPYAVCMSAIASFKVAGS